MRKKNRVQEVSFSLRAIEANQKVSQSIKDMQCNVYYTILDIKGVQDI